MQATLYKTIKTYGLVSFFAVLTACGTDPDESSSSINSSSSSSAVSSSSSSAISSSSSSSTAPIVTTPCTSCTGVIINEAVSSNSEFEDEDGDAEDWLELFNNSNSAVSLAGWSLSDDPLEPNKWTFPAIQLAAKQYLLIWASDKDRAVAGQPLHLNFKISAKGETLYLFNASLGAKHSLEINGLRTGTSVGLSARNQATVYYDAPTPGAQNGSNEYLGVVNTQVAFSDPGGINSSDLIMLSGAATGETIHYTLDGTVPTEASPIYMGALPATGNAVVRARIFAQHYIPSITQSRTFLPDASHDIAVVTLETAPDNFFDIDTGIYVLGRDYDREAPNEGANFWQDWERETHFSFYEPDGSLGIEFDTGVKIFGGYTRSFPQKALAFYARGRYGADKFEYPFFPDLAYSEFENLVLRASGNDWLRTMIRDRTFTSLMEDTSVDYQAGRPVAVYLNGEYLGLHNLREKVNEHFIDAKHDVKKSEIDLLEGDAEIIEGSNLEYLDLIDFVSTHEDPSQPDFYEALAAQIDIDNFIAYQILQIYIANTDWPERNIKFWKTPETKWRWILYDTDFGFGLYTSSVRDNSLQYATAANATGGSNPAWSTLLLRKLLQNPEFEQQFISYFADQLNSRFLPSNVKSVIDQLADQIRTEIPQQSARWVSGRGGWNWASDINSLINYGNNRPAYMWQHLQTFFGLSAPETLSIADLNPEHGHVVINSLTVDVAEWSGQYFAEVPVTVTAVADAGYVFSHWIGASEETAATATLTLVVDQPIELTPVFVANLETN